MASIPSYHDSSYIIIVTVKVAIPLTKSTEAIVLVTTVPQPFKSQPPVH
jgi:hypothetical protein